MVREGQVEYCGGDIESSFCLGDGGVGGVDLVLHTV